MSGEGVEILTKKFDDFSEKCSKKLAELHTDVVVIKREVVRVERLDKIVRGNGDAPKGLVTRVSSLEDKGIGKEKFVYVVLGCLITSVFTLGVTLLITLT